MVLPSPALRRLSSPRAAVRHRARAGLPYRTRYGVSAVDEGLLLDGRLDCAHNNAGISGTGIAGAHRALTADYPDERRHQVIAINLTGVGLCMKYEIAQMLKQGIRVNCICPGYIQTPMTAQGMSDPERRALMIASEPVGRVGNPEEVAEAVVWLCSDAASFVTGHAMTVDGGYVAQ